ncbi:MAG: pyruvate carboxylase [Spirochaetia bacterium]|nr:pyruvate carboxylase [Spirochaetia bacterium]
MAVKLFKKVMSANRGEIAIRTFRACGELGLKTVAIYSNEDRLSLYRTKADESYLVGKGKKPVDAYLGIDEIIELAKKKHVDAIHPGYGFLSENPEFSQKCEENGIVFIGPTAEQQRTLGDKIAARTAAKLAGVPTVPGTESAIEKIEDALIFAKGCGFPIIIKAAAGGGGRGMRVANNIQELKEGIIAAKSEAKAAFGDDTVFLEKYLVNPKHIEIQIMGDNYGNIVHFFERDCSIQRRHQKVVEFAPSLAISDELRKKLCESAIKIASQVKYRNAGTVEFLVDKEENYYFIEMNPRLQVEHTVTELITGWDLVRTQLLVAQGYALTDPEIGITSQDLITKRGYAIQCRITTEDPENNFAPDMGTIKSYKSPAGYGVRLDAGNAFTGSTITDAYDSLLVKVSTHALTFKNTATVMKRALGEFKIRGVKTNIPFLENVVTHPIFLEGKCDTSFIQDHPELKIVKQYRDRASRLMNFLANTVVNGNEIIKTPRKATEFREPPVPELNKLTPPPAGTKQLLDEMGPEKFSKWIMDQKKLLITDTTMRDAHQSLLATRFRTYDLSRIADATAYLAPNLFSMEMWGGATFDVALRFLKECPWARLEKLREAVPNILFQMLLRSSNAVGYTNYPDNVIYKFVEESAKGGIDLFRVFDCLNNTKGLSVPIDAVLKTGKLCEATMCYTGDIDDPKRDKYPLKYYVSVAKELERMGTHILGIKDMAGLIKPYAATKLIKALKEELSIPVHLHTHDTSGNGVATLLRAADAGVDIVDTAISAVSGVTSQPSLNAVVAALKGQERDTGIDISGLNPLANYWEVVRTYYSGFESDLKTGTAEVYYNEIPGGQYSNYKPQVAGLGLIDKWEECKKMYHDVNELFGDVIKVTPSSKIVADMAMFLVQNGLTTKDVIAKANELTFPQSVIDFMKGMVGQPYQGFPADVQKAILKGEEPINCRPGELLQPVDLAKEKKTVEDAIERHIDDQQLMSYIMYPHVFMDYIKHRKNYFDVSLLPTPVFFYGLEPGQEITVQLDEGKTLIIKLISVGSIRADGTRTVYFELNGLQRTVSVRDNSVQTAVKVREKADKFNKHHVGAPMPGKVFKMLVKQGDKVEEGDVLLVTEAMKMETNIKSAIAGTVKDILYDVGETVEKGDLIIVLE